MIAPLIDELAVEYAGKIKAVRSAPARLVTQPYQGASIARTGAPLGSAGCGRAAEGRRNRVGQLAARLSAVMRTWTSVVSRT